LLGKVYGEPVKTNDSYNQDVARLAKMAFDAGKTLEELLEDVARIYDEEKKKASLALPANYTGPLWLVPPEDGASQSGETGET
jgi:hypothetical protein